MDSNIFSKQSVKDILNKFVLVKLYTDNGENHRENQQYEIDRFETAAQPYYVLLDGTDNEIARFAGMTRDAEIFINFLKKGLDEV